MPNTTGSSNEFILHVIMIYARIPLAPSDNNLDYLRVLRRNHTSPVLPECVERIARGSSQYAPRHLNMEKYSRYRDKGTYTVNSQQHKGALLLTVLVHPQEPASLPSSPSPPSRLASTSLFTSSSSSSVCRSSLPSSASTFSSSPGCPSDL